MSNTQLTPLEQITLDEQIDRLKCRVCSRRADFCAGYRCGIGHHTGKAWAENRCRDFILDESK